MPPAERVRTAPQLLLEILELLVCALVLDAIPNETGRRTVVQRLRSSVCFYHSYYGPEALCLFANHLCSADAVMVDFHWLMQAPDRPEPEAALLDLRNQLDFGG